MKILLIDDDADNRAILKIHLTIAGHQVEEASNGEEGITAAMKGDFGLVILDLMMPKMDGWQVCKTLKSSEKTKNAPVILLTAMTQPMDELRGWESGANEYLPKPVDYLNLLEAIKRLTKQPPQEM